MTVGLIGVAGALAIGGALLYGVLTVSLTRSVEAVARASAEQVALLVDAGRLPDPVPVSGAQVIQVLDQQGRVVDGSIAADRLTALVTPDELQRALAGGSVVVPGNRSGLSGGLQVVAVPAGPQGAPLHVVAAAPTTDIERSAATVRTLLLISLPLLLVVIGLIAWRVVGAALAPVEALRRGAARIDASSSETERLPVPPTHDEVSALATTLNAMLDRVTAARRQQRAFTADAAHELRNPLASMRAQLEVAQHLGEAGDLPQDLLVDVDRLSTLVDDLLLLARADESAAARAASDMSSHAAPEPSPRASSRRLGEGDAADVAKLLADVVRAAGQARVPVRGAPRLIPGTIRAAMPEADLRRALSNLVDNAVRHAATSVVLAAARTGHTVRVTVTDDGHGVPVADRMRVFERFTRLDEGRDRDSGGSGLGLAITKALVRQAGGDVWLEDAAPGTRAVISVPAVR
ncbi:ATP-binding protein [Intrasporangium sp.]|uniref:HAMP domain-containing sensor histidine kinase n=1 Tax=Intrasporangium sp. TaxID=1925024 RepID=UPI00336598BC